MRTSVGWEKTSNYLYSKAIRNSIVVTAKANDCIIGMARMITDGGLISTIVDVMIHPTYQNQGIGNILVRKLLAMHKEQLQDEEFGYVSVLASKGNDRFYKAMGFMTRPNVMLGPGMTMKILGGKMNKYER